MGLEGREKSGEYVFTHKKILAFWRRSCPGAFYEISYEALVADPETQSRALVAAAGLDWEDACLNFYQGDRSVKTLSIHQVRQPIYTSSVGGWKKYESELTDLLEALEEETDDVS